MCLPLLISSCTIMIKSRSSGTGSPGWSRKKGPKMVVVWWCGECKNKDAVYCSTWRRLTTGNQTSIGAINCYMFLVSLVLAFSWSQGCKTTFVVCCVDDRYNEASGMYGIVQSAQHSGRTCQVMWMRPQPSTGSAQ